MIRTSFAAKLATMTVAAFLLAACSTAKTETPVVDGGSTVPMTEQQIFTQQVGDRVFFDLDSYSIRPDGMATLHRQAEFLQQHPQYTLRIEGHCDERGTREYNLALGDRRANAVREALVSLGIDRARLTTISYGKERPECTQSDEGCWQLNRKGLSVLTGAGS
ncbi:MAG: peptidoglycan-associated lipoprotein Pal [Alphaproteobacteria bacterium]|nr:peptidoglycan-associated lipoprotein Pal [Alphaproteobacteria bacterium]